MIPLQTLDRWRHRIPFWWWLTYDALVLIVILLGFFGYRQATLWLGLAVLAIAVFIDTIEFIVKRPSARAALVATEAKDDPEPHPLILERAALRLANAADDVDKHIMGSGLAYRRGTLRDAIIEVQCMVEDQQTARRGALSPSPD